MPRVLLKKAEAAPSESSLAQLLPQIDARYAALETGLRNLEAKVDNLREDTLGRFERQLALMNEIKGRVVRLEGKLEGYREGLRLFTAPTSSARTSSRKRVG